jgi:hypothetical protein
MKLSALVAQYVVYNLDPAYSGVVWTRLTPCLSNCGVTFGRLSLTSLLVR